MSENKTSNLTVQVEGRDLIMERVFDAPRDLLFKVYSEPEHLENWWGPQGWQTKNKKFEFKPGGVWHYCMTCMDRNQGEFYGQESWGKGTYQEIIEPEKIVYIDQFSDEEGNVPENMPEMLISLTFVEQGAKTKLIIRTQFASAEELQKVLDMGVVQGFESQIERLDELLKEIQAA
ncbi:uncharacterized protein YndB with AHSA1/START domain [Bacillus oleivorans]|uniref:Uncharacterized protein YndB with AHSA1/START domain n=1 Tax=Bacillus oleivorans TaxID=1448271 RepID=A0A285D6Y0_9BACI|nr:SRPBCC domain-containing protein [Bacillus oleivorans]SNX75577.1 uncharacterized protein YndB with AHSA1/START domain [Bacillus oleivorans]